MYAFRIAFEFPGRKENKSHPQGRFCWQVPLRFLKPGQRCQCQRRNVMKKVSKLCKLLQPPPNEAIYSRVASFAGLGEPRHTSVLGVTTQEEWWGAAFPMESSPRHLLFPLFFNVATPLVSPGPCLFQDKCYHYVFCA